MFLSHQDIEQCIKNGQIEIGPDFDNKNIRPVGVRMHLGKTLLVPIPGQTVDLTEGPELKYGEVDISKDEFYLEPGQFVLGSTFEMIKTAADILVILDGRSTIARIGLTTHVTASTIDGAFEGPHVATLEIKNMGNFRVRLKFKDPIAMMLFAEIKTPVTQKAQRQYGASLDKIAPPNLNFKTGEEK